MMKVIHIADTHIRNLKYHEEYREIFSKMFSILREEKPDYIVHCGDIAHTKNQISPEFVEMCSWFLKELADIAPTFVILGNHDCNLKNDTRQDSISPIVSALNHPNLKLWKHSGERIINDNLAFNVLSLIDEDKWVKPSDPNKINIALYHGAIAGVSTDVGYTMEHSDHDLNIFEGHDYAFLGDIHKTNQSLDDEGRVRYPGSTVQQNHGETDDKGFLIWDIEDKNKFNVRHVAIPHPKPFITIKLDENGKFDETITVKPNARIRVMADSNISANEIRKTLDVIKVKFQPESVSFVNKVASRTDISEVIQKMTNEDLRSLQTQEKLLTEYLKDFNPTKDALQKVFELNKKYNSLAEENEEVCRNVRWSLKSLKWDNMFNYGSGNSIDFNKLNGVVGIFGKNFCGKSSIIDSLLWGVQNSTSKNIRKNVNIINQNQENCRVMAEIIVDDKQYSIERTADKYIKKISGEETLEAKTDVTFSVCDVTETQDCEKYEKGNLNGLDRNETDKNIRNIFGTLEDFLFTSMSSQNGSLDFINEGSTRRKEILGKFLDLDIFAKKYKLSNADAVDLKSALKRLETKDYDKEILEASLKLVEVQSKSEQQVGECAEIKREIEEISEKINKSMLEVASMPKIETIDIVQANNSLSEFNSAIKNNSKTIQENEKFYKEKEKAIESAKEVVKNINIQELTKNKNIITEKTKELDLVLRNIVEAEKEFSRDNKDIEILKQVPCGDSFPSCKFLVDAFAKKSQIGDKAKLIQITKDKGNSIENLIKEMKPDTIESSIAARNLILEKIRNIESIVSAKKLENEKLNGKILVLQSQIDKLQKNITDYYVNEKDAIRLLEITGKKNQLIKLKEAAIQQLATCDSNIIKLHREHGSLEQKIIDLQQSKTEMNSLREEYAAISMFEKAMHGNGISYDIIRKKLPVINEEISKILANIVNFEIFFEDDGKKLDILIKHAKYEKRPIELASGAEKSLAAMAIRLALTKITSLPVGDIMILDEPATALDEENMEGFTRIVEMLKSYYKTILLISHLPELKDIVDKQILISNENGYAHVEV